MKEDADLDIYNDAPYIPTAWRCTDKLPLVDEGNESLPRL